MFVCEDCVLFSPFRSTMMLDVTFMQSDLQKLQGDEFTCVKLQDTGGPNRDSVKSPLTLFFLIYIIKTEMYSVWGQGENWLQDKMHVQLNTVGSLKTPCH